MNTVIDLMKYFLAVILFPIAFIITLPIEYPLWKAYKDQYYDVPNYLKFFWHRCMMLKDISYKKRK